MNRNEIPHIPIHEKIARNKSSYLKFQEVLCGNNIQDLPLDFIGTEFFSDYYLLESILGAGSFGVVLKVLENNTGEELAMKVCAYYN